MQLILVCAIMIVCPIVQAKSFKSAVYSSKAVVYSNKIFLVVNKSVLVTTSLNNNSKVHTVRFLSKGDNPNILTWDVSSNGFSIIMGKLLMPRHVSLFNDMIIPLPDLMRSVDLVTQSRIIEDSQQSLISRIEQNPKFKYSRGSIPLLTLIARKQGSVHDLLIDVVASDQGEYIAVQSSSGVDVLERKNAKWIRENHYNKLNMSTPFVAILYQGTLTLVGRYGKIISLKHNDVKTSNSTDKERIGKNENNLLLVVDKKYHQVHQFIMSGNQIQFVTTFLGKKQDNHARKTAIGKGLQRCISVASKMFKIKMETKSK